MKTKTTYFYEFQDKKGNSVVKEFKSHTNVLDYIDRNTIGENPIVKSRYTHARVTSIWKKRSNILKEKVPILEKTPINVNKFP